MSIIVLITAIYLSVLAFFWGKNGLLNILAAALMTGLALANWVLYLKLIGIVIIRII